MARRCSSAPCVRKHLNSYCFCKTRLCLIASHIHDIFLLPHTCLIFLNISDEDLLFPLISLMRCPYLEWFIGVLSPCVHHRASCRHIFCILSGGEHVKPHHNVSLEYEHKSFRFPCVLCQSTDILDWSQITRDFWLRCDRYNPHIAITITRRMLAPLCMRDQTACVKRNEPRTFLTLQSGKHFLSRKHMQE